MILLVAMAAFAFAGRAAYVLAGAEKPYGFADQLYYRNAAESIAEGRPFRADIPFVAPSGVGLPEADHPPLTALVLAPVALFTGDSELPMRFTVALAGVAAVVLIGLLGAQIAGRRVGVIAAAIAAVYPNLWVNDGLVMSETFAVLGTAAVLLFVYRFIRQPTLINAALSGVMAGVAMLARGEELLLLPLLLLPVALMTKGVSWARRAQLAGVMMLTVAVTIGPWVVFNLTRFEKPVLLSYDDAGVLLGANCFDTYAGSRIGGWDGFCTAPLKADDLSVAAAQKRSQALRYMRAHIRRLPLVAVARVGRVWTVYGVSQTADIRRVGDGVPAWGTYSGLGVFAVLAVLAASAVPLLRRRRVPLFPLLAPFGIVTLVAATFYGSIRFRMPAEVSIVVLAAVALERRGNPDTPDVATCRSSAR
jgi:4-amino-4-deoxy-L-arabinose transferase-like glycosyltransferase